jgi:hypothetical protein
MKDMQTRLDTMARQLRTLRVLTVLSFCCAVAMILTGAAQEQQLTKDSLTLRSPDGQCTITLKANNENGVSGVWITRGENDPQISMINGGTATNCAFGVSRQHSKEDPYLAFDAAIGADKSGGYLQMIEHQQGATFKANRENKKVVLRGQDLNVIQSANFPQRQK